VSLRRVAEIRSVSLRGAAGGEYGQISSEVEVLPSATLAAQNNVAARSSRAIGCITRVIPHLFGTLGGGGARYGRATVSRLPNPLPGADGGFGFRISTAVIRSTSEAGQTEVPVYVDLLGFISGPAEINLTATGAPQPVPADVEHRLLSLLYSRANAKRL
jgi:hypothetical protein